MRLWEVEPFDAPFGDNAAVVGLCEELAIRTSCQVQLVHPTSLGFDALPAINGIMFHRTPFDRSMSQGLVEMMEVYVPP